MDIYAALKSRKDDLIRKQAENALLNNSIKANENKIAYLMDKVTTCREAFNFVNGLATTRRSSIKIKIESILSEAVCMIYGANHRVELAYSTKNNRSHMDIELVKNTPYGEFKRTMEGFGGGVSDCISVPLRLLVLLGSRQTDKVCVLDEAYKHVDPERIENVAQFVQNISKKLGIQLILLSHHDIMQRYADVVYQIQDNNGKSSIKCL